MTAYVASGSYNVTLGFGSNDSLFVTSSGNIDVASGHGIFSNGSDNSLAVDGQVFSRNADGVRLFARTTISVSATGSVFGEIDGFRSGGGTSLTNAGTVVGDNDRGVDFFGTLNVVVNSGAIFGRSKGVFLGANGGTLVNSGIVQAGVGVAVSAAGINNNITNTGTIDGGIDIWGGTAGFVNTVVNRGTIFGPVDMDVSNDVVINSGFIGGGPIAVDLGASADFYDGRLGGAIGAVRGGSGDDVLYGGIAVDDLRGGDNNDQLNGGGGADALDGGSGYDFARYDFGGPVTVSLAAPAVNTGEAAGDTFTSIEGLVGSNGADTLIGDGAGNTFFGLGGNDAISGGAGADSLYGDAGADILFGEADGDAIYGGASGDIIRGGLGGDLFVYALGDQGDTIQQFNEGGVRDGFDLRPLLDATGYTGTNPRSDGILAVLQNGADTDVYLYGVFFFRIDDVTAGAIDDTYFLFQ